MTAFKMYPAPVSVSQPKSSQRNPLLLLLLLLVLSLAGLLYLHRDPFPFTTTEYDNGGDPRLRGLVVLLRQGLIQGRLDPKEKRVREFLAVPYAQPPVDQLRWQPPQPSQSWSGVRQTVKRAPACVQVNLLDYRQSEDCLYLDVYAPTMDRLQKFGEEHRLLPVMVWIHGGAWLFGSGTMMGLQNPRYMVEHKDVVVVSVNYRLGPLGFLATRHVHGNFGLQDQRMALHWVRDNIQRFGGDPNAVTLWGESAGAMSIAFHLLSPQSQGLFHRAILESAVFGVHYRTREEAIHIGEELVRKLGCPVEELDGGMECMRQLPAHKIMYLRKWMRFHNLNHTMSDLLLWEPLVDGREVLGQPMELLLSGRLPGPAVPILMGFNRDETGLPVSLVEQLSEWLLQDRVPIMHGLVYKRILRWLFKEHASRVLRHYPAKTWDSTHNLNQLVRISTDYYVACPKMDIARALSLRHPETPIYLYSFDYESAYLPRWFFPRCREKNICHAMELPYVFHSIRGPWMDAIARFSAEDHFVSHAMIDYWVGFARGDMDPEQRLVARSVDGSSYDHDNNDNQEAPRERVPWNHFLAGATKNQRAETDAPGQWLVFDQKAHLKLERGEYRKEWCQLWRELGHNF